MHDLLGRGHTGLAVVETGHLLKPASQEPQRDERNHHDGERWSIQQDQCNGRKDHVKQAGDHFVTARVEQLHDRVEVVGLSRDYATRGVGFVKLNAQLLRVPKQATAQRKHNVLVDSRGVAHEECDQRRRNHGCGQISTADAPKRVQVALDGGR